MSVPSRSKKAPISGPSGLASISAIDRRRRGSRGTPTRGLVGTALAGSPAPTAMTSSKPCPEALGEEVGVGDRGGVVVDADEAPSGVGRHDDHHRRPRQRPDRDEAHDAGPALVDRVGVAGDVAGLDVGAGAGVAEQARASGRGARPWPTPPGRRGRCMAGSVRAVRIVSRTMRIRTTGSGSPTGAAMRTPDHWLPAAGSSPARRLIGMASGRASTGRPMPLVVEAQGAAHRGDVGVVDRGVVGLGRAPQVGEGDVVALEPPVEAPAPQQGRRLDRRGLRRSVCTEPANPVTPWTAPPGSDTARPTAPTAPASLHGAPRTTETGSRRTPWRVRSGGERSSGHRHGRHRPPVGVPLLAAGHALEHHARRRRR